MIKRQTRIITDKDTGRKKEKNLIMAPIKEDADDIYVKSNPNVTLDILAEEYYGDATLWWVIARANSLKSMVVKDGISIRIPRNPTVKYEKE